MLGIDDPGPLTCAYGTTETAPQIVRQKVGQIWMLGDEVEALSAKLAFFLSSSVPVCSLR